MLKDCYNKADTSLELIIEFRVQAYLEISRLTGPIVPLLICGEIQLLRKLQCQILLLKQLKCHEVK